MTATVIPPGCSVVRGGPHHGAAVAARRASSPLGRGGVSVDPAWVDAEQVVERAEQLRRQFVGHAVGWQGELFSLTVSLGCATQEEGQGIDSLLQVADKALYQAKSNGRNRVVFGRA